MKYSAAFNRDFNWFLKMRHIFDFDGALPLDVEYDKNGIDGKKAFLLYDSQGKLLPTKHPILFQTLIKIKGGINLHIKMYAEDRASGLLSLIELRGMCIKWKAPSWFREAVERQKVKYWK